MEDKVKKPEVTPAVAKYLAECGRMGGSVVGGKKAKASRANGKCGGRPRGSKNKVEK